MKLSELHNGEKAIITKVLGRGAFRKRITEMGFVKGKIVEVIKNAPLKDPVEYSIMGYSVSLRRSEAAMIEVIPESEAEKLGLHLHKASTTEEIMQKAESLLGKTINVALVGNPNTGKTSLFNYMSGAHEHVGNYAGVTVELKTAQVKYNGYTLNITDLPGTYSLSAYSPEEISVRTYIAEETPDIVINVVDATNLERNLYLTTQLIDMDIKVVMALNMYDELVKHGDNLNQQELGQLLGIPIVPTVGSKGKGLKALFQLVINTYNDQNKVQRHVHINYGEDVESAIAEIQGKIRTEGNTILTNRYSTRFLAIKLLEKDKQAEALIKECPNAEDILNTIAHYIKRLETNYAEDSETIISDAKYGFIAGAIRETFKKGKQDRRKTSALIDKVVTNKILGFPIFLLLMWLMFYTTFALGEYPMEWISGGVEWLSGFVSDNMPDSLFKNLLSQGIIEGVGSVLAFLPNILILFFFISLFEDTGYMARAVFITDKLMHAIGLHGKSFIPLIMGFGCGVPAIMATRVIENKNQRLITMLMVPFMSCSARLPVYILLIGTFFAQYAGTVLFLIYLAGIVVAIISAFIFSKFVFKEEGQPFVMELPPYRVPTLRSTLRHMWYKGSQYLKKMGGVILIAAIAVWALNTFPLNEEKLKPYDSKAEEVEMQYAQLIEENTANGHELTEERDSILKEISLAKSARHDELSYLGRIGKGIEPAMRPLGFDWKMSVSLLTGIIAKETVVSTMAVLYQAEADEENTADLSHKLREEKYKSGSKIGQPVFTNVVALAFLAFVLLYFPCVAAVAAIYKESKSKWFTTLSVLYTTGVAWIVAFAIYQIGSLIVG